MIIIFLLVGTLTMSSSSNSDVLLPHCRTTCGNLSIPYPFGIGSGCFREGFEVTCKEIDGIQRPFFGDINSTVAAVNISLLHGQVSTLGNIAYKCDNKSGFVSGENLIRRQFHAPYTVSSARNSFFSIGCDTIAYFNLFGYKKYIGGCTSFCLASDDVTNGSCTGVGCNSVPVENGAAEFLIFITSRSNISRELEIYNPCSYAFLADKDWFKFSTEYMSGTMFMDKYYHEGVPLVLDWTVGRDNCRHAIKNSTSYACRSINSKCVDSNNGYGGYLCNCSKGYQGNPYLQNGCQDIDECSSENKHIYPCNGECANVEGGYMCTCPSGTQSDDPRTKPCEPKPSRPSSMKIALGTCIGSVSLIFICVVLYMDYQKRKLTKEKKRFFEQNGGFILYQELKSRGSDTRFRIFRKEELERATNMFDKNLILGRGGHGTVYLGTLDGNVKVAIKKSKVIDESQKKEFVKEMLIMSQINHKNIVKILGCCLEVEVPMLVYEYIANGTLYDYIHKNHMRPISLYTRLRIAVESAEALAYLHSSASPPILHGDVKSSNILLDENYEPRVSDFGASTLVVMDEAQLTTVIQGTYGYLDPEYMQTYKFTEKSDVYSFGVVLLELLTRKKAFYITGSEEEKSLASIFLSLMKEGRFEECMDDQLVSEGNIDILHEAAELVKDCLSTKGDERPTMKELAEGIQRLTRVTQHPWSPKFPEEVESLIGESTSDVDISAILSVEMGRS